MKQRATTRNKSSDLEIQKARQRKQPKMPRPVGLPRDVPFPPNPRIREFVEQFVKLGVVRQAALAAGYSQETIMSHNSTLNKHLDRYSLYIEHLRNVLQVQTAKTLMLDGQTILDEIARIGMANEFDYLKIEKGDDDKVTVRRKHLHELSREDMVAIKIVRQPDGKLAYDLRDKEPALMALGKNLGLFNDKLIIERRTTNLNATMDLTNVPSDELKRIIDMFENTVTKAGVGRVLEAQ